MSIRNSFQFKVCALSDEERVLEQWLGCPDVIFLPQIVSFEILDWRPVPGRVGFAGTLDHTPNLVALNEVLRRLTNSGHEIEFEIIGRPAEIGDRLSTQYPFVRYLGGLPEKDCREAASRWSLFLNPVFWLSRGASTKLGQGLAWGLPVLTTRLGRRGYEVPAGTMFECRDCPDDFVNQLLELATDPTKVQTIQKRLIATRAAFVSRAAIADRMREWVSGVHPI
jgi:glycosyltransferase involved in cell wall biosynthesis